MTRAYLHHDIPALQPANCRHRQVQKELPRAQHEIQSEKDSCRCRYGRQNNLRDHARRRENCYRKQDCTCSGGPLPQGAHIQGGLLFGHRQTLGEQRWWSASRRDLAVPPENFLQKRHVCLRSAGEARPHIGAESDGATPEGTMSRPWCRAAKAALPWSDAVGRCGTMHMVPGI